MSVFKISCVIFYTILQMSYFVCELQQVGLLCAQHCLNALVQDSLFSAAELAEIAAQLDEEERTRMAEAGLDTAEYQRFLKVLTGFSLNFVV